MHEVIGLERGRVQKKSRLVGMAAILILVAVAGVLGVRNMISTSEKTEEKVFIVSRNGMGDGAFCAYRVNDSSDEPCLSNAESIWANVGDERTDQDDWYEVTAIVSIATETYTNSANPPQSSKIETWHINEIKNITQQ